ncbi:MAG: DUF4012 domain-containing protein [Microbacterium sp.]
MPHETRKAARAAAARDAATPSSPLPAGGGSATRHRRSVVRRRILLALGIVLIVVLAALAWLAFRALTVKDELAAAQKLVTSTDDDETTSERVSAIASHAAAAAEASGDPVWLAAELVPVVGDNLRAVRLAAQSLDLLTNDLAVPALEAMSADESGSPLELLLPLIQEQAPAVSEMADAVADVKESPWLVEQVRSGIEQVDGVLQTAAPALEVVPPLLGADGAKNYLLVFQNNAETLPLGGSAASQTLIAVDNGAMSIVAQAGSGDFTEDVAVDVPVDESALTLYTKYLVDHVNNTTSRPDFPTAAQLLRAFWQRDIAADQIDAVMSVDPLALARILKATGPITAGDVEITSDNAVSVLLSEVYVWWNPYASEEEAAASDAFFAEVAAAVFAKIAAGDFDVEEMLSAVGESIDQGSIMMWSDDADLSPYLEGQRVAGILPTDNDEQSTVGVFYRNSSGSKIDYYMDSSIAVEKTCDATASTFTAQTTLTLDLTQDEADALPEYVQDVQWGSSLFGTDIFIYGPPGTTFVSATVDGRKVSVVHTDISDLGHPVASFGAYLAPGESVTVTATFSGTGDFGPLEVRSTPMINSTDVSIADGCS